MPPRSAGLPDGRLTQRNEEADQIYSSLSASYTDRVVVDLEAKGLRNDPLTGQSFNVVVQLNGNTFRQETLTTDRSGKCKIAFNLPDTLRSSDGLLNVTVDLEEKRESISRAIPIVLNKIDLQFFPEGGEWVAQIDSLIREA